jgi:phosphoribosylformylglycinamidine synthase
MIAVCEAARNIACTGAKPLAITNCLNFGNPYDPEVYWQFTEAIRGMGDACRTLETPVTGGNVSFYNESPNGAIYPTPTIGMLGVIDDISNVVSAGFKNDGDAIILFSAYETPSPFPSPNNIFEKMGEGKGEGGLGGSEYLRLTNGKPAGNSPNVDPGAEARLIDLLVNLAGRKLMKSAHDISEGGLAVTLAESSFPNMVGANIKPSAYSRKDIYLFGEMQGRVVVSAAAESVQEIFSLAQASNVKAEVLGITGGRKLVIEGLIDADLEELLEVYSSAIPNAVEAVVEM